VDWVPFDHLLDHVYALAVASMDDAQREAWDEWLWSDPQREARIMAGLGLGKG
jgi:hypothetical protein